MLVFAAAMAAGTVLWLDGSARGAFVDAAHTPLIGPVLAVLLVALLVSVLVPRSALALAAGLVFGTVAGSGYVLAGLLLAAAGEHALGRWLGSAVLAQSRFWRTVDRTVAGRGICGVALVRLLPAPPYGLAGLLLGAGTVPLRRHLAGSALGAAPNAVGYAAAGGALVSTGWAAVFSATAGAVGIGAGIAVAVHERRRLASELTTSATDAH